MNLCNCSPRYAARSYCLIMSAAFPSSAIRMASIGLYPSSAIESRKLDIRHQAWAWCSVRKHPETLILTFDILIFCSPVLLVKLTSGSLMKRSTESSFFNRRSCRLCPNDFATRPRFPCRLASEWSYTFFGTSGIRPRSAPRSRSG